MNKLLFTLFLTFCSLQNAYALYVINNSAPRNTLYYTINWDICGGPAYTSPAMSYVKPEEGEKQWYSDTPKITTKTCHPTILVINQPQSKTAIALSCHITGDYRSFENLTVVVTGKASCEIFQGAAQK